MVFLSRRYLQSLSTFVGRSTRKRKFAPFSTGSNMDHSKIDRILAAVDSGKIAFGTVTTDKMLTMTWNKEDGWNSAVIRPYSALPIYPCSSVLNYATSVFDAFKAYYTRDKKVAIFRLHEHIRRLNHSCSEVTLPVPPSNFEDVVLAYARTVEHWTPKAQLNSLYFRILVFGTTSSLGVRPPTSATLVVVSSPVSFFNASDVQSGMKLLVEPKRIRAGKGGLGHVKAAANYAYGMYSQQKAVNKGYDFILWLSDTDTKQIAEIGTSNLFIVTKQHTLVTPKCDETILPGITRQCIIDLAGEMGLEVKERDLFLDEVMAGVTNGEVVEMFGSGTAAMVLPVQSMEYEGKTVHLQIGDDGNGEGTVCDRIKQKLIGIHSNAKHPWMTIVSDDNDGKSAKETAVKFSDDPLSPSDLM